jgi:hypothetical protein
MRPSHASGHLAQQIGLCLLGLATACTTGAQRTAIVLASAPSAPPHPYADKAATASVFYSSANPTSARSFFAQASYGLLKIVGHDAKAEGTATDVYGPLTTPSNACSVDPITLADPAIDYTKYSHLVLLLNNPACSIGGEGATGPLFYDTGEGKQLLSFAIVNNQAFGDATANGKIGFLALHEYGHTLTMQHGAAWYCGAASTAANGCYAVVYQDPLDILGYGLAYPQPNSVHKDRLGGLPGSRALTATSSGTYTLHAYEDGADDLKVLRIPRKLPAGAGKPRGFYYLSYRHPTAPWDAWFPPIQAFTTGVAIHIDETGSQFDTGLIDATPGSNPGFSDAHDGALLLNQTFNDNLTGVSVTVMAVTDTDVTVNVTIPPRSQRYLQLAMEAPISGNMLMTDVGSVSGGGVFDVGQTVSLTATPNPGWAFSGWWDYSVHPSQLLSQANPYTLTIDGDVVITAKFAAAPPPNDNLAGAVAVGALPSQYSVFTAGPNRRRASCSPATFAGPVTRAGRRSGISTRHQPIAA